MSEKLELKSISEILDKSFYIPAYQRGYRWSSRQVIDLLKDIWEFASKRQKQEGEFYCLQPIVVKRTDSKYIVIDGQQRLTTLYIVLKYLEQKIEDDFYITSFYDLEYETRNKENENSSEFLKKINNIKEDESKKNIDFYYMNNTFNVIKQWFTDNKINKGDFLNILLKVNIIEENKQKIDIANNVRVIWYEIDDENEIDVFTRLNIGKIPLTNAELIKAIFLINTKEENEKLLLASQWDEIEYKLQDNSFFAFVSKDFDKNNELKYPTRIEFIFDLIANKSNLEINNLQKDDERRSYYIFNELIKDNNTAKKYWDEVKKYFRVFNEFYSNQEYYHLVGFLVHNGVKIVEIVENFMNNSKDNFLNILKEKIKQKNQLKKKVFEELNYEEDYDLVTRILFLFNVISTMKSNHSRYPFELHAQKWSLEHIHAQKSENITKIEDRKTLLEMQLKYIDDKTIKKDIEDLLELEKITEEKIIDIENRVSKLFIDKEIHTIDNLALLSRDDNSSLNNSIFPAKRDKIKKLDKESSFIPICTKNVFLKYYSNDVKETFKWNIQDRKFYLDEIKETLKEYLGEING
ncbi:hypothetical protein CJ673_04335 [Aliarcobacter cryaerophilus]|uniref:GmrSD restriction endonucleases N-terminal domain-containing protein n=1 Tax=Aliarcobacter cryaerophilus TaxID=28198 RepID=A0A2S9T7I3_9BACT|nr:DUF262 domain-containing protein [Aliarcobacter cryaerophilus]PRM94794.1 hypothetical protein CJ673_04335 [Aliarcobacter cryaerophilus]